MEFEKIITFNDESYVQQRKCVTDLLFFMEYHNQKQNLFTTYFSIRTRDSEKCVGSKDMILRWITERLKDDPI